MSVKSILLVKAAEKLKPLTWIDKTPASGERYRAMAMSPITRYVVVDDGRGVIVVYHNFTEDEPAKTKAGLKSVTEAKDWVEGEHYPSKMVPWLNVDQWVSINDALLGANDDYIVYVAGIYNYVSLDEYLPELGLWDTYGSDITHWQPMPKPPRRDSGE